MTLTAQQARRHDVTQRLRHLYEPDGLEIVLLDPAAMTSDLAPRLGEFGITAEVFEEPVRAVAAAATSPTAVFVLSCHVSPHDLESTTETVRQLLGIPVVLACDRWDSDLVGPAILAGARPLLDLPYQCEDLIDVLAKVGIRTARSTPCLHIGQLMITPDARDASVAGQHLDLSPTEFAMLHVLALHVDSTVTRVQLSAIIWPTAKPGPTAGLAAATKRLRRKLDAAGLHDALQTVRGVGYRLDSAGCVRIESSNPITRDSTSSTMPATSSGVRPTGSSMLQSR